MRRTCLLIAILSTLGATKCENTGEPAWYHPSKYGGYEVDCMRLRNDVAGLRIYNKVIIYPDIPNYITTLRDCAERP